jgi:hypothetical protein
MNCTLHDNDGAFATIWALALVNGVRDVQLFLRGTAV